MRATSMNPCIIAVGSVTHAMKGQDILTRNHISTEIVKLKAGQTTHGCSYGLSLNCMQLSAAKKLLDHFGVAYGDTIGGF